MEYTLFLCGDVMTGRGIDQVLPHPSKPDLYESSVRDARTYVRLAERANGPIPRGVDYSYIWGEALAELERAAPDIRLINLETSVTHSEDYVKGKGINYRMHPDNIPCLTAAKIDGCALANNHVIDWGYTGLLETLEALHAAGIKTAGAGRNYREASAPAIFELDEKGRILVFSFGSETSGIPPVWAALEEKPGVHFLPDLSAGSLDSIRKVVQDVKMPGDIAVASIHWGSNWGFEIPREQQTFARGLIDRAAIDIVHAHSSHHVRPIEVYRDKLILYGCGDFINDYEGIGGREEFRGDLSLMYFASVDQRTGALVRLRMVPTRMRRFRVGRASREDANWLLHVLNREGRRFRTHAETDEQRDFLLHWD